MTFVRLYAATSRPARDSARLDKRWIGASLVALIIARHFKSLNGHTVQARDAWFADLYNRDSARQQRGGRRLWWLAFLPHTFLIDPEGKITKTVVGSTTKPEFENLIKQALLQPGAH